MDQKTPKGKLLEACGVRNPDPPSRPAQDQESKRYYQALLDRKKIASASAQQAQDQTDQTDQTDQACRRLNNYIHEELPRHLVTAFEKVAEKAVLDTLRPLDEGVRRAVGTTNEIGCELCGWSWFWLRDITLCAVAMGLLGGTMVRCAMNQKMQEMDQAKRYELWGRAVEQKVAQQPPEKRRKFRAWLGTPEDIVRR